MFNLIVKPGAWGNPIRPTRFAHELGRNKDHRANYVAVTFAGWGRALPALRERFLADTEGTGFTFTAKPPDKKRPNPGLIVALPTKPANNQGDFASQRALLEDGIRTALRLQAWLRDNQALLTQWHSAVDAVPASEV